MTDGPVDWVEANIDVSDAEDVLDFGFDDSGYHNFYGSWDSFSDSTKQDIYQLFGGVFEEAIENRYGKIGEVEEEVPFEDIVYEARVKTFRDIAMEELEDADYEARVKAARDRPLREEEDES